MTVDMRSFLQEIKKTNDVFTVKKRVSTKYEIAAVTEKLDGSKAPCLKISRETNSGWFQTWWEAEIGLHRL